jgi:hypothetical protein
MFNPVGRSQVVKEQKFASAVKDIVAAFSKQRIPVFQSI